MYLSFYREAIEIFCCMDRWEGAAMLIREIEKSDLPELMEIYTYLHDSAIPAINNETEALWCKIMNDPNHHIVVGITDNRIISTCVLMIIPNLTHNQRPYALIENVITHPAYRNQGHATQILEYVKSLAVDNGCYKIMLMTGSKKDTTLNFYEHAGYNRSDKTAFIQWLI